MTNTKKCTQSEVKIPAKLCNATTTKLGLGKIYSKTQAAKVANFD